MEKMIMNKRELDRFKRQMLDYEDLQKGYAYVKYSKRTHKYRIALSKRTWWIRRTRKKMELQGRAE